MREFEYRLCDVFTDTPFQGNQLAVFESAEDLTPVEMQRLAHETNLSETTFIVRRSAEMERLRGLRVRIFTTQEELPFAGHPTLGTSACIRQYIPEYAGAFSGAVIRQSSAWRDDAAESGIRPDA